MPNPGRNTAEQFNVLCAVIHWACSLVSKATLLCVWQPARDTAVAW